MPVDGCFGCKVLGVGFDGGHVTRTVPVLNDETGQRTGSHIQHRDGRQDALANPGTVKVSLLRKGKVVIPDGAS